MKTPSFTALAGRGGLQRWLVAGLVGGVLGIAIVGSSRLAPRLIAPLVLALALPFVAMVVGNVRRLLMAIIILDIPLQQDVHLGYMRGLADLGALGGVNISATTICLLLLYALWLAGLLGRVEPRPPPALRASLPLACYLGFVIVSSLVAQDRALATFEIALLVQMFLLYVYVASVLRTPEDVIFIVTMLVISLALEGLIMVGVAMTGRDISIAGITTQVDSLYGYGSRVGGTLRSPNSAAAFLSMLLAPALSLLLTPVGGWTRRLAVLAAGVGTLALVLTLSRGGWLAFAISSAVLSLAAWRRGWLSARGLVALVAMLLCGALLFQGPVLARLLADDGGAAQGRVPLMWLAFRIIEANPVLGVGANNFVVAIQQYTTPDFVGEWLYVVHNKYLLVWAEIGTLGFAAFLLFLVMTIRRGWQGWMAGDRLLSPLALGFTAAVMGHMAHMLVDIFNLRPETQLLWLIAGLLVAMRTIIGEKPGPARGGIGNGQ